MGLKFDHKDGYTLLAPEEMDMLIPTHITNRIQLDEAEQDNIEDAIQWVFSLRTASSKKLFSREFQDKLHKKMLGKVWKWAGQRRTKEANIGVNPLQIEVQRKLLNDDALFWVENKTWPPLEMAIRFHHRLIQIHCYPNGNGRHGRIIADIILKKLYNLQPIEWIAEELINESEGRKNYIIAMKSADKGDYSLLLKCIK